MSIKELRQATGMTQKAFGEDLGIPKRTLEDWENERRVPPAYVVGLVEYKLRNEEKIQD